VDAGRGDTDSLPPLRVSQDDENPLIHGLLTDVDDLLEDEAAERRKVRRFWRWVFYPLAIGLLAAALLVPKPSDLANLWHAVWRGISQQSSRDDPGGIFEAPANGTSSEPASPDPPPASSEPTGTSGESGTDERRPPGELSSMANGESGLRSDRNAESGSAGVAKSDAAGSGASTADKPGGNGIYYLFFESPHDSLDDVSERRLKQLTVWMQNHPASKVVITGLSRGGDEPVERMREALVRAEQISARLESAGIPMQRIFIEGSNQDHAGAGVSIRAMSQSEANAAEKLGP